MGILELPEATVRALGASQVLTDPAAVVKELIDNALDANATSITIEIHSNTLDIIQVRDNGYGIAPEDRPLVAKRYCTSKISHDDDLKGIGGCSLGFRGEALASAAELSGTLTISTCIEGEQVAAVLKIDQLGQIIGQERASLPVGTTVRITDFIKMNPVRRQVCLKNVDNTLKKIKRTVQAYAFARPHVRLALKVLKAKNSKCDWTYAPKPNGNAGDAAFKIVGAACASQCMWSVLEQNGFTYEAFLPGPGADPGKISSIGSFVSLDRRPVSTARNTFKQIAKIYREALKGSDQKFADIKDPFLYLEISCPKETYDANLEPAKDDVVFEDAAKVLGFAGALFAAAYGKMPSSHVAMNEYEQRPLQKCTEPRAVDGFNLGTVAFPEIEMLATPIKLSRPESARLTEAGDPRSPSCHLADADVSDAFEPSLRTFRSNMYGCDEEDMDQLDQRPASGRTEADFAELRQAKEDVNISNPWVMAKLNSSTRTANKSSDAGSTSINLASSLLKRAARQGDTILLTPRGSSPSPPTVKFHPSDQVPESRLARDGRVVGSSSLPPPQLYTPDPSSDVHDDHGRPASRRMLAERPQYAYSPTTHTLLSDLDTPLHSISDASAMLHRSPKKPPRQAKINKPFMPSTKQRSAQHRDQVWFDHLQDIDQSRVQSGNRPGKRYPNSDGVVAQGELGDLVEDPRPLTPPRRNRDIPEFTQQCATDSVAPVVDIRNDAVDQENVTAVRSSRDVIHAVEHQGFVPASKIAAFQALHSSPVKPSELAPKRRRTSEKRRALQDLNTNTASTRRAAEDNDNDEYRPLTAIRAASRRKSSGKLSRTKSSKLPLERTPAGQGTYNMSHSIVLPAHGLSSLAARINEEFSLLLYKQPAIDIPSIFEVDAFDLHDLTNSVHDLLLTVGADDEPPSPANLKRELQIAFENHKMTVNEDGDQDEHMSALH